LHGRGSRFDPYQLHDNIGVIMKVTYAKRVPPGDRWQIGSEVFESLTECLNQIFIREQITYFEIDAASGNILIEDGNEAPKAPPKMWDLYGEKGE
jgi:hypothetical protein